MSERTLSPELETVDASLPTGNAGTGNPWGTPPPPHSPLPPLHPRYGAEPTAPTQDIPPPLPPAAGPPPPLAPRAPRSERQRGRGSVLLAAVVAAIVGAVSALGAVWATGGFDDDASTAVTAPITQTRTDDSGAKTSAAPAPTDFVAAVAEKVRPAIVNVQISTGEGGGSGSGVIFTEDGYILTNNHVVEQADEIAIELTDGRRLDAKVVGTDPDTDTAVVKVEADNLPTATLGTATKLTIGAPVVAIGYPLGQEGGPTVSSGVVSALGREVQTEGSPLLDMIQTDAAISPGSSGGALLDAAGSVIGITTAKASTQQNAEGIGFATPIDIAHTVAEQLIKSGRVERGFLGVAGLDAVNENGGQTTGARIDEVTAGTPAAAAGLQEGDVVTAVNGEEVDSFAGLRVKVRTFKPGEEVTLTVQRDGKEIEVKVKLASRNS